MATDDLRVVANVRAVTRGKISLYNQVTSFPKQEVFPCVVFQG